MKNQLMDMTANGFMKTYQKHPNFKGLQKDSISKRNEQNFKGENFSKVSTDMAICHGHGLQEHMIKDCLNRKTRNEKKKFKVTKENKTTITTAWRDSESSENEEAEREDTCLMVKEDLEEGR